MNNVQDTNLVDANNSNIKQTAATETATKATKIVVRTRLLMVNRGQSEETQNALFFDTRNECPHTDINTHVHDLKKGFSRSLQAQESGIMQALPLELSQIYSDISGMKYDTKGIKEAKAQWLYSAFMLTMKSEYKLTFELIPANKEYKGTQNDYEWWACTSMELVEDLEVPDRLIARLERKADKLITEIKEEAKAKANALQWGEMEE